MRNRLAVFGAFALLIGVAFFAYGLTLRGAAGNMYTPGEYVKQAGPTGPFESSHERASYAQYIAHTKYDRYDLPKELADFSAPDVGFYKGKFYSFFPPGIAFAIAPLAQYGEQFGLAQVYGYATMALMGLGALLFLFLIARRTLALPLWASLIAALTFGFATVAWCYSLTIYQHIGTTLLMTSGFYFAWRYRTAKRFRFGYAFLVGGIYGVSPLIDYPNVLLLLPLMVYFTLSSFRITRDTDGIRIGWHAPMALAGIGFVLGVGLLLGYNQANFGSYLQTTNTLPRYEIRNLEALQGVDTKALAAQKSRVSSVFLETNIIHGFYILTTSPDKGILVFSPILLLGVLGFFALRRKMNAEWWTLLALALTNLFVYVSFGDPWGGWAYGPRYLVPAMAILSLFVGVWITAERKNIFAKALLIVLFAYSMAVSLLGALTTGLVPPKVEADYFGIKYGIWHSMDYLWSNQAASYPYDTYFASYLSLPEYYLFIYIVVFGVFLLTLLFGSDKDRESNHSHGI